MKPFWLLLACAATIAGCNCSGPNVADGRYACFDSSECVAGYECSAGECRRVGDGGSNGGGSAAGGGSGGGGGGRP